jgi:hypothetical protein
MNKINLLSILLILIVNCSCDRTGVADNIYEDKLINQTNKELFIASYFDVKNDSAYCHKNDSVSLIFIKKVYWSIPFAGPYSLDEGEYPKQIKSIIYNLSDTTVFSGKVLSEAEKTLIIYKFSLAFRKTTHIQYVTNGFLTLFDKDYSMLDKFKDYYKK